MKWNDLKALVEAKDLGLWLEFAYDPDLCANLIWRGFKGVMEIVWLFIDLMGGWSL